MDQGDYAKSWETAADGFRKEVTKDGWVTTVTGVRKPLGNLISRKVKTTQQTDTLPGMPPGSYYVAQFDTSFAGLESAAETVIFTRKEGSGKPPAISSLPALR
jgi:serine/threonine-protein kinase